MIILFNGLPKRLPQLTNVLAIAKPIYEGITQNSKISIRNLRFSELNNIRETWLVNEGWPAVKHGLHATYSLDPTGFYCLEKDAEPIASISLITYPDLKLAYVGFYVVPMPFRGMGYGELIFNKIEDFTRTHRNVETVGLNCYHTMSPMYNKWGFRTVTIDDIWKLIAKDNQCTHITAQESVKHISDDEYDAMFDALVDYDTRVFGMPRIDFLNNFINKPETVTAIFTDEGIIKEYGIISARLPVKTEPNYSYRVGPLYANDPDIASKLLQHLIAATNLKPQDCIFLEAPGNNPNAAKILTKFEFEKIASMDKMYKGPEPEFDTKRMFCYTSLTTGG